RRPASRRPGHRGTGRHHHARPGRIPGGGGPVRQPRDPASCRTGVESDSPLPPAKGRRPSDQWGRGAKGRGPSTHRVGGGFPMIDRVLLEILRNHYQAIVEDMARIMERTAYTTFVKETADFSTGLVSAGGEYVAYPWSLGASSYLGLNMAGTLAYFDHYDE